MPRLPRTDVFQRFRHLSWALPSKVQPLSAMKSEGALPWTLIS
jgi:hypothetical protein